ncbi:MAG TPA: hypothetical protein VMT49_02365 [Steroidobacteraceae bacterium]|nr:hypothetical protein [Steroidobacteraceae bacterium]
MERGNEDGGVVAVTSLAEWFRGALHGALANQHVDVDGQTEQYLVNLLTLYARAEHFYEGVPNGPRMPPLVSLFGAAVEAGTAAERERALQRLGDISLFIAGFFAHGFARRLVDIDYHIAMGGRAYGTLAEALARGRRRVLAQVYAELAAKFQPLVDALGEISDSARTYGPADALRLYEIWLRTGSARARRLLAQLGISASPVALHSH